MTYRWKPLCILLTLAAFLAARLTRPATAAEAKPPLPGDAWRAAHRIIDLHQHIGTKPEFVQRALHIMDEAGIGIGVNLSGGTVTRKDNQPSEFEQNLALANRRAPGRFLQYMNLDYTGWDKPDFSERAVRQVEEGFRLGAAGLKEYKRLGLYLRDGEGKLIKIDSPKLDPVWKRCGELGMPVSIHVADPRAFWLPFNEKNERWKELKDHRPWWFGDTNIYPAREDLLAALNRVIERNPKTTFVCVHFANNAEEIDKVDEWLDRYPNMMADIAARIPELGRHNADKVRRLFTKHQDRIFFATDFQVYDRLTLGSGGSGPEPTDADAALFYAKHWTWFETKERHFTHMTPIQGDWTIDAIGLPSNVLRKIYFDNARRLLARSLPLPVARASRINADFPLKGDLRNPAWKKAAPVSVDYSLKDSIVKPELSTEVRLLWSDKYLYLGYKAPYTDLTLFDPPNLKQERVGLWDKDVVELFIDSDPSTPKTYYEFEVAPTGEWIDLELGVPKFSLDWNSGWETVAKIDSKARVWTVEMRIPLASLGQNSPRIGARWRMNLYRHDIAHKVFMAWNPSLTPTAHTPERFGILEFGD
ncbi:MAG TPA: amidohydrolase family protein [Verrucomicrobiae bacterium]|nr:amidohydrolase family protein [Verrucomicrobiae bacterium]